MPVEPCHPKRDIYDCTCYSNDQLRNMARHLKKKGVQIRTTGTRKQLWVAIRDALKDHCEYDFCWRTHPLLKEIVDDEMKHETFRPLAPFFHTTFVGVLPKKHIKNFHVVSHHASASQIRGQSRDFCYCLPSRF